ncbi:hypothetical protein V1264_017439 [Littorina saxatilis]|uniref:Ig-like domain-containing protein n=1 Tax=Littorina saxatilis TaxID=31220 RepID=A0AAN9BJL7_9CAEN
MITFKVFVCVALGLLGILLDGVEGQTVVVLEGGTATFNDVTVPGTGGTVVSTAGGQQVMQLDIFGSTVFPAFQNRVTVTSFNNGFRDGRSSFVIRNVQKSDAGNFQCQSQFEGQQPCGSATLVVAGAPTKPTLNVLTDPIIVGNDVIVECQSTSTSVPASSALKLAYNLKENGRLALPQPTTASRFKISSISKAKKGARYSCIAYEQNTLSNQLTGLQSTDSDVYIMDPLYPPEELLFDPPRANYAVSSSETLPEVTCTADCNPACTFDWYKGSQIFQAGDRLSLGTADKNNAGNYFCRATNNIGNKDKPLIITVEDSVSTPTLIPPTSEYNVPEGTNVDDIFCRAECTPECTYTWLKDGQRLLGSQGIRLGTVGPSSSGRYTCRASNGEDLSEVSFDLDVQYPPKDLPGRELISPSTSRYQVEEGALVLPDISCNADCNPPCTVQWTKAGVGPYGPGSVLSLGAASRDDTGTYTCTANNTLGQTTTNVEVLIEFRPEQLTLTPPGTRYNSVEGDDAIPDVRCSAVCNPDCDYEWYKGDGGAPLSDTAVISLGTAARAYDGTYTCRASNKVGEDVISFDVSVLYGPEKATIEPPQGSYKVPTGTLLPSVTCSADCNPGCSYRWVKDDSLQPITTLRTLTLGQAEPNTNGIYKCLASNDYGSADTKFDLAVQFGPSSTVQLQPPQSSHDLSEGDDLTVTCDATCDPPCNFRWEDTSGSAVAGSKTLKLTDVTRANAGTYTCVADNGVGTPARRPINVNVLIGPSGRVTITPAGPVISLKQGNSFVLTCSAECSPVCTYKWLKDTQELPSRNGILTLNDVNRNQNGAYTCEATNVVGLGAKDIVLDIKYGPGNSVSFTPDKASHSAEENSDLSVTCSADCKPECEYVWKRGLTEVALTPVLYLEAIQRKQAGTYSCTANNEVSQPSTQQISVDVLYGPAEVRMFPDEAQLYPVKGSSTSLKCWATCNPECTYIWYKGSSIVPDSVDGELDLRNVTTETSGNYLCVASNNVGEPATRSVEINVRAGPGTTIRFSPPDDTPIVMEGRQFQVECIAECSPPCTYEWRKGSEKLTNRSVLEFPETDREKAGSYICFASNDANSQASKPLTLEVTFGPGNSIHLFPPDQNQSYAVGVPFNIKCAAECDPECTYKWFLGPKLLPYDDGVLFSDAARMDQAGTYTCVASNGIGGATTKSVTIDVHAGPGTSLTFTPPGSKQVLREGGSLSVTCSADCNPPCTYMWIFNEEEIPTSRGRLELSNVGREEKGVYSCLADNGLGNQGRKPLNVEVQYGPEGAIDIFPADGTQVLNEGASLALKCSADCSPDCSYTWFLGNEVIDSKDGVLSLVAVGPENAGTYRCSAENSIGLSSSEVVTVVVQTGPGNTVKIEPSGDVNNVTEGEQLEMRCSAVCSPPCTYTWYFGVERVKSDDGVLTIDEVPRNMSGPFVCYAANDVGLQGSRLIKVDIQYGPTDGIDLDPANNVTVVAGSPFYLRCSANCDPPCKYTWYQGPLPRESEGGRLAIRKAAEGDGGSFTCRARNVVGSLVSDVVDVEVQYGPRDEIELDPPGPTYVVQEGDDVTVTCSADCKPGCKYSWFAGSEQVDSNNGKLVIENYQRSMPRFYSCFADNGLSTRVMAPLQVEVHCEYTCT